MIDYGKSNNLTQVGTNPTEIKSILETLQTGKASGPDDINNYVLKTCSSELSYPLSQLFNLSLSLSKVPKAWKEAYVTPFFLKNMILRSVKITDLYHSLVHWEKLWKK